MALVGAPIMTNGAAPAAKFADDRERGRACPFASGCDIACGMSPTNESMLSIAEFQARCGLGTGASVHPLPRSAEIVQWAREALAPSPARA